jgi:3'-5' exoribonuclease
MKSPTIGTLVPNSVVTAQFLVVSKEIRQKKTGEPYLSLHLSDRTGEMEAKMWDNVTEVMNTFERDDFIKVKGIVQIFQNRAQFTVHKLRRLEEHEVDFADYFPCSDRDVDEMFAELLEIVGQVQNSHLRALLDAVLADSDIVTKFKLAPAAKNIHHACRGGLLEHVLSLCTLSRLVAGHYKNIDLDLLITAAILHDIGKIEELTYARSFGYSSEGQLLGHIVIGLRTISSKFDAVPGFPPKLRTLVEHMIVSHHGELEFGSPKVPVFPEALLFHHLDNLDSKMEAMRNALKRDTLVEGEFTGWISSLERVLLKKDRYLKPAVAQVPPAAPQATLVPETAPSHEAPSQPEGSNGTFSLEPPADAALEPQPAPNHVPEREERARQPQAPITLFGEKLQAVLQSRR